MAAVPPRCACPGRDAGSGGHHPEQVLPRGGQRLSLPQQLAVIFIGGRAVQCLGADLPAELRQNRSVCDRGYGGRPALSPAEALSERHDRGVPFLQHGRRHQRPPCRDAETIPGFLQPAHPQRPAAGDREPVGAGNDTLHPVHGAVHQPADQRETGDPEPEPAAAAGQRAAAHLRRGERPHRTGAGTQPPCARDPRHVRSRASQRAQTPASR